MNISKRKPSVLNLFPTIGHADNSEVYQSQNQSNNHSPRHQDEVEAYDPRHGHKKYFLKEYANSKIGTNVMLKAY